MTQSMFEIQLVAAITAAACVLPGVFLVLRRMAMMSDAISHTVLLGIVLAFFLIGDLESPLLVVGAAVTGVLTVTLVEMLHQTKLVKQDAAIGLVFPMLFSIAVILISRYAGNVHLDVDAVLLGELAFSPFDRWQLFGISLPKSLVVMGAVLLLNVGFIGAFYKELKIATFDPGLAAALGLSPLLVHYGLMTLVSVTAVGAFDAVGSILVVALMIAPPAAAYLLTDNLPRMMVISIGLGVASAIGGYWLARTLDANIAGSIATMNGFLFLVTFLFAPKRGIAANILRRQRQKWTFALTALAIHLFNHENTAVESEECRIEHLTEHLRWPHDFADNIVKRAQNEGLVVRRDAFLQLTAAGRMRAEEALTHI
ncbi:MAG: metal ABC transporter permease [Candidatus Promineifilaceae bacterium]